jgi:hypothetical protein
MHKRTLGAFATGSLGLRDTRLYDSERRNVPRTEIMTLTTRIAWDDTVLPFQLDRSDIRGRVARLDTTLERSSNSTTTRRRWRRWWPRWRF